MKFALKDKYPIETEEQLIKAAEYFDKNLFRFYPKDRVKIASNLDSQANKLKINLEKPWITNYTRIEKSAKLSPSFKEAMKLRKEACARHNVKLPVIEGMEKAPDPCLLLDEIIKISSKCSTEEMVNTITEFDKRAGIEYLYDDQIFDPYMTVFGDHNNPEFDSVKLAGDATQYDLMRASRDHEKLAAIKDKLGEKFAKEFNNNPITSLSNLKSPEKTVLSIIMR